MPGNYSDYASDRHLALSWLSCRQEEIQNVIHGVFTVQVGAPSKTKQGQRLITLGVAEEGLTDDHTQRAMSSVHQMDSILNLSGHKNNESMKGECVGVMELNLQQLPRCSVSERCIVRDLLVLSLTYFPPIESSFASRLSGRNGCDVPRRGLRMVPNQ